MASIQITTTNDANGTPYVNSSAFVTAGNRIYVLYNDGTNLVYRYSDDTGQTWSAATTVHSGSKFGVMVYDQTNSRMEFMIAGGSLGTESLQHRAITSNVTSGVPGALTTEIAIDAGGANLGVGNVSACICPSVSNPRIWVIGDKQTAAGTQEMRIWWCAAGTSTDTVGNWSSQTNVATTSDNSSTSQVGRISYQKIGGNDRVFAVMTDVKVSPNRCKWILFDPTTATPGTDISGATTRTGMALGGAATFDGFSTTGNTGIYLSSYNDAIIVGVRDRTAGTLTLYYSTDGITFTAVTSGSVTAGRAAITTDGTDFHVLHSATFGLASNTSQVLNYRKLTWSTKTLGSNSTFSDNNGNGIQLPPNTGTTSLVASYRSGTASPYPIRFDLLSISSDTTPPGLASTFTGTAISSGTEIDLSAIMPSDSDTNQYEIRRLSDTTFPKSDRTDGTIIVAATATTPGATVTFPDTGLTGGTVYSYRLFNRDATGNWNTGVTLQVTAATTPTFSQRYKSDGTTTIADGVIAAGESPVLEFACVATDFKAGSVSHFRLRYGSNNATPPSTNPVDLWSGNGAGIFRYETTVGSGTWTNVPGSGLPSSIHQRASGVKIRVYTPQSFSGQLFFSLRREQ